MYRINGKGKVSSSFTRVQLLLAANNWLFSKHS